MLEVASALRFEANRGLALLREIASGRELKKLLAVSWLSLRLSVLNLTVLIRAVIPGQRAVSVCSLFFFLDKPGARHLFFSLNSDRVLKRNNMFKSKVAKITLDL